MTLDQALLAANKVKRHRMEFYWETVMGHYHRKTWRCSRCGLMISGISQKPDAPFEAPEPQRVCGYEGKLP
jgi:hypothetical protein